MNLLIIDTSVRSTLCVAVTGDEAFVWDSLPAEGNTSTNMIPNVDKVLSEASIGIDDVDVVAAAVGPGSFTGLRIGVSVANAFGVKGIKLLPVNLLEMLSFGEEEGVLTALPSRAGFAYTSRGEYAVADVAADPASVGIEGTGAAHVLSRAEYIDRFVAYARAHAADASGEPLSPLYLKKSQAERLRENPND